MKKTTARFVLVLMALGALGMALLLWRAQPARAQGDTLPRVGFSRYTVGLTRGFSAKLMVVNTSGVVGAPPDPCRVELLLAPPDPYSWTRRTPAMFTIGPGEMASLMLNGNDLIPSTMPFGTRMEVAGVAKVTPPDPLAPPDPCRATLQIINNATGITTVALSQHLEPQ